MTEIDDPNTEDDDGEMAVGEASTWTVSVCFWTTLMVAAVCYGAVALSPKFSTWSVVRDEHRRNGMQLADLEKQVDYLERVKTTLETDSDFVDRLTQSARLDESVSERIAVSGNLLFGEADEDGDLGVTGNAPKDPRSGLIFRLASGTRLRGSLLIFSACLTVFAFTFLNDAGTSLVNLTGRLVKAVVLWPAARYVSSVHERPDDAEK